MTDLRIRWDNATGGGGDFARLGPGLDSSEDIATAVALSLFSDRLAEASDAVPFGGDRRGWWGDSYPAVAGDRIGSRLWLLSRAKATDALPLIARGYILEALHWMIDDGVAKAVEAECFFIPGGGGPRSQLGALVTITRGDGTKLPGLRFAWAWQQLGH